MLKNSLLFVLFLSFLLTGCFPSANPFPPQGKNPSQAADEIITKFSKVRLQYALSTQDTPSNREILKEVVWQEGYFLPEVLLVLEKEKPTLMKKVFGSDKDKDTIEDVSQNGYSTKKAVEKTAASKKTSSVSDSSLQNSSSANSVSVSVEKNSSETNTNSTVKE